MRSGVLTSVHAFAVDAERGLAILWFLAIVIGCSLLLYSARAWNLRSNITFAATSRENLILGNNLILTISALVVLLGTLYPLGYEAFTGGAKISIGPPYFNAVFVPLMLPLLALMALSATSRWRPNTSTTRRSAAMHPCPWRWDPIPSSKSRSATTATTGQRLQPSRT